MDADSNQQRITRVVREHHAFVWRVLRRCGLSDADADDAAQRVMLVAARRMLEIPPENERAFLFRAAWFVAQKERRARRRRPDAVTAEDSMPDVSADADPEQLLIERRAREQLDQILACLSDDLRIAFVAFEIEGMTKAEVASILGIAPGTAASRLRRAREEFSRHARRLSARTEGRTG